MNMFRKNMLPILLSLGALNLVACGGPDDSAKAKKSLDAGAADIPCTAGSCPAITLSITGAPMEGNRLRGNYITPDAFTFTGVAQGGASRDIRMIANNPPIGGDFVGQNTLSIRASYKAIEAVEGQAPISVVIRDVSRCKIERPQNIAQCEDMKQLGLEAFETKQDFPWFIGEGDMSQIADPTYTGAQSIPTGANSGASGCINNGMTGAMGGILQGGFFPAIMGGVMGCVNGSYGNLGK